MKLSRTQRVGIGFAAVALVFGMAGCAGEAPAETVEDADTESAESAEATESAEGSDEYAFGSDRETMATAIESAFSSKNGSAEWKGDTLVLSIDGDANESMAGFTECMVLAELLNEGDAIEVAFPNGSVDCAEVLADI